jgi:nucleoside-diphosphate-sugar epimerase
MKKILIIGGTGFIGYHLAKECLKLSWSVTSLSSKKPKTTRLLKKVNYLNCDISKGKKLNKLLKKNIYDFVVNLGGYINHFDKIKTYNAHFLGVKNLANIFLNKKLKSFVQIGSSAEYGKVVSPQNEKFTCKPTMIYGKSKLRATNFLLKLFKKRKFPVTILRFYQVYGPKQNIDRFIPLLIDACIKNTQFQASHGKQKRDFLYVDDAVYAILKTLNNKMSDGKIVNIGSGKPITLLSLMKRIKKKIGGGDILLGKIKLRKDEPLIIFPYLNNAIKILNWKSKTTLKNGINKTIESYMKK